MEFSLLSKELNSIFLFENKNLLYILIFFHFFLALFLSSVII